MSSLLQALRVCLVAAVLLGFAGRSHGAAPVRETVAAQVMAQPDSLRTHTLGLLARGQVTEAIEYWVLATGKPAPGWLVGFKTAFEASKQVAGTCQGVARSIYTAFSQLGVKPEFVELRAPNPDPDQYSYIVFKMANGRDMMLSNNGYHMLVRMNGRAYDAYTGASGLPWAEYLSRLGSRWDITQKVVEAATEAP